VLICHSESQREASHNKSQLSSQTTGVFDRLYNFAQVYDERRQTKQAQKEVQQAELEE